MPSATLLSLPLIVMISGGVGAEGGTGEHVLQERARYQARSPAIVRAFDRGVREAARDIAKGKLRLKVWGFQDESSMGLYKHLQAEYGVAYRVVAGCVVEAEEDANWSGYNARMIDEIDVVHGKGTVERATEHARDRKR